MANSPTPSPTPVPVPARRRPARLWLIGCPVLLLLCVLVTLLSNALVQGLVGSSGALSSRTPAVSGGNAPRVAQTSTHFLSSLQRQAYDQAYSDLDSSLLLGLAQPDFVRAAQAADHCYGPITSYQEISSRAASNGQLTFTYQVSRKLLPHHYTLTITLQSDASAAWYITNYGNGNSQELDLAPGQHACTASYSQPWFTATTRPQSLSRGGEVSTAFGSAGRPKQGKEESHEPITRAL